MTGGSGRYEITQAATDSVLEGLSRHGLTGPPGVTIQWQEMAAGIVADAVSKLAWIEPPTTRRQDELDGEYVLSLRAQATAADLQAEHARALSSLVERSEELADLQTELTRRQLAEVGGAVNEYTLWKDALLIAATVCPYDSDLADLELFATQIRESLRWAGNAPVDEADPIDEGE